MVLHNTCLVLSYMSLSFWVRIREGWFRSTPHTVQVMRLAILRNIRVWAFSIEMNDNY